MKKKFFNNIIFVTKDKIKGESAMELFRNIFFNTDKLIENTDVKVTYAGKLFQDGAQNIEIHYGFGDNWENVQDLQMEKTELGFQANIHVQSNSKLNFCFKNENNEWDNNQGQNFSFSIEKSTWDDEYCDVKNTENSECEYNFECNSLCNVTPTWAELIKKTFSNFINYITKLFSRKKENIEDSNWQ